MNRDLSEVPQQEMHYIRVNTPPAERVASGSLPKGGVMDRVMIMPDPSRPVRDGMIIARHEMPGNIRIP